MAERAGGDNEGDIGGEKDDVDDEDGMRGVEAGSDDGTPNLDACKGRQARQVSLVKVGAGTSHLEPVQREGDIVPPVLELVGGGTDHLGHWKGLEDTCLRERGQVANSGPQHWKSPGTSHSSRNFGGNARLMEGSGRRVLELVEGCNDLPGVALGLVCNALQLHCHCGSVRERVMVCTALQPRVVVLDQGAGTGGGDAAAVFPAAHSPRQELSSCCPCAARCQDI